MRLRGLSCYPLGCATCLRQMAVMVWWMLCGMSLCVRPEKRTLERPQDSGFRHPGHFLDPAARKSLQTAVDKKFLHGRSIRQQCTL